MEVREDHVSDIRLDLADLKHPPPQPVRDALHEAVPAVNKYPSGDYADLKRQFAEHLGVDPENIVFGNGLDEVIDLCTRRWGGESLIPAPTFSEYAAAAARCGQTTVHHDMLVDGEYHYELSDAELDADIVWICSPNNPTGTIIDRETVECVAAQASGMVIVDECYHEFGGESVVDLVDEFEDLVVLRSFSKSFGLAGVRLGAAVSQSDNVDQLNTVRQPFNVNRFAERGGRAALEHTEAYEAIWRQVRRTGQKFAAGVRDIGYRTSPINANFVLCDFSTEANASRIYNALRRRGITSLPGWDDEFTGLPNRFIRFTIGRERTMDRTLEALRELG